MNSEYILKIIKPYLNEKREISETEFVEAFNMLTLHEQYKVIEIMIENDIELVDYKDKRCTTETEDGKKDIFIHAPSIPLKAKDIHLKNEQLCVMYQNGDMTALEMLLIKNERFIYETVFKAQKGYNHKLGIDDLLQEGRLGLIKAAKDFDVQKGYTFLTYAWSWIRQYALRSVINEGYAIRLPMHIFEKVNRISALERDSLVYGKKNLTEYIQEQTGLKINIIMRLMKIREFVLNPISLNQIVGEEDDTELQEFISDNQLDTNQLSLEDEVVRDMLIEKINEVLHTLTPREEKVIRLRFGIDDGSERTLEQVSNSFGVTRERVRQIEKRALKKLKQPTQSKELEDFLTR